MTTASPDLIYEYLLGQLPEETRRQLDAEMRASSSLRREVDAVAETLALAAANAQAPLPADPALRARLLATVSGVDRFAPFLDDLVRLFELPVSRIRELLGRIDDASPPWERQLDGIPLEAVELFHFAVGPTLAATGAAGGVIRVRAGGRFPAHHHDGDEMTYVLEGGWVCDGEVRGPGSRIDMTKGSQHDCRSAPERDLVTMVLHHGVTLLPA